MELERLGEGEVRITGSLGEVAAVSDGIIDMSKIAIQVVTGNTDDAYALTVRERVNYLKCGKSFWIEQICMGQMAIPLRSILH